MILPPSFHSRFMTYYTRCSCAMALYGMTRAFRMDSKPMVNNVPPPPILVGHRLMCVAGTGILYSLPGWNVFALLRLMNRVQIQYNGWNRYDFLNEYQEVGGYCMDTF